MYWRMDQAEFVEDSLLKTDHITTTFLKALLRKFYFAHF